MLRCYRQSNCFSVTRHQRLSPSISETGSLRAENTPPRTSATAMATARGMSPFDDSNYWVWINGITFTVPLYSVLGYFTGGGYNNPIPIGNMTYTIEDMAQNYPPLNIVGYQINPNQCLDCPYSETLIGTRSRYTYNPQQQIFFDNQMIGDTAKIMIEARFGEMSNEIIEKEFNIIFN